MRAYEYAVQMCVCVRVPVHLHRYLAVMRIYMQLCRLCRYAYSARFNLFSICSYIVKELLYKKKKMQSVLTGEQIVTQTKKPARRVKGSERRGEGEERGEEAAVEEEE